MKILIAIVHYWNPEGNGRHASLRPDPIPRIKALQAQLLCLKRLGNLQGVLNINTRSVDNANQALRHTLDIKIITDGKNHVLDKLDPVYASMIDEVVTTPSDPKYLGFEAQRFLADNIEKDYDLYAYFEDDLQIRDPCFFHKINWFQKCAGSHCLLMPNRYEQFYKPATSVDRFYIDGPMVPGELAELIPNPPASITTSLPAGEILFSSPNNPHSGCFVLSRDQLKIWREKEWFLDYDCSLISPLESAATLGLLKTFDLYKPHMAYAGFLEIQHWGSGFFSLIGNQIDISNSN